MYCFASNVGDKLLSHIRDAKVPTEAWTNVKKVFMASTTARKLQLWHELRNVWQKDLLVADYTTWIKDIFDSLTSNNVTVEEDKMG